MKSRNILIAALIMAIVTTILFRQYLKELDKKYKSNQNRVSIVVAKQGIAKHQLVTKEMLEIKEFSADSVHPEAIMKVDDVLGNYALTDIKPGETIFLSRFTNQFKENELITRKIREGYRAVAIEVNIVESVANLIQPEDYVDVTFSEKLAISGGSTQIKTETILENVRVLAVGKRIVVNEKLNKEPSGAEHNSNSVEYNSVTLELKPEEIVKLINADERGNIKFVLRSKISP